MTDGRSYNRSINRRGSYTGRHASYAYAAALALLLIMTMACAALMSGCAASEPEKAVTEELESYRDADARELLLGDLEGIVDESAREDFEAFAGKIGEFEYKITDVETGDDGTAVVTVKITTYSFGREYLSTWTDFLADHEDGSLDEAEFYERLMKRLGSLELKTFDSTVKITCVETGDGWQTDASSNLALRDALLGGMITEIAALADM